MNFTSPLFKTNAAQLPVRNNRFGLRLLRDQSLSGKGTAAFTLVEMIVSMAILSILSLMLVIMLNQVSLGWAQVRTQMDTRQNARSVLTLMASEIRLAALPKDRVNTNNLQFVVNPSTAVGGSSSVAAFYPHGVFFQAPIATDRSLGNMAEVGYYIRWDTTTNPNNPHAMLCRYFVNPGTSGTANADYLIYSSPSAWLPASGSGSLDSVSPLPAAANGFKSLVADNVIGLWVRCLDLYGYPITQDSGVDNPTTYAPLTIGYNFNSRLGYIQKYQGTFHSATTFSSETKGGFQPGLDNTTHFVFTQSLPYAVEIAVVVIDSRTASLISGVTSTGATSFPITGTLAAGNPYAAASSPTTFWNDINTFVSTLPTRIQKGARIYSTRVQLVNGTY